MFHLVWKSYHTLRVGGKKCCVSKLQFFPCLQICKLNSSYPPSLSGIQHIKDTLQGFSFEAWPKQDCWDAGRKANILLQPSARPKILGKLFKNLTSHKVLSCRKHHPYTKSRRKHPTSAGHPSLSTTHGTRVSWIHELCPEIGDWTTTPKVKRREKEYLIQQRIVPIWIYNIVTESYLERLKIFQNDENPALRTPNRTVFVLSADRPNQIRPTFYIKKKSFMDIKKLINR